MVSSTLEFYECMSLDKNPVRKRGVANRNRSSFFIQQATFCVNSLAHWLGDQPFDDRNSPRDHVITALVTLGEGYHK